MPNLSLSPDLVVYLLGIAAMAGTQLATIRHLGNRVDEGDEDRAAIRRESLAARDNIRRSIYDLRAEFRGELGDLERRHEAGTPALLKVLENIEKMQVRQEDRIGELQRSFTQLQADLLRDLRNQQR